MSQKSEYVDLKVNGRIFPSWILKNFRQYKLPPILRGENEDPCNVKTKMELRKYQEFIGKYLGPKSPYTSILIYHGLGSGKTATSINVLNVLYNYNPNVNTIILIKASLLDDPWMKDLKIWLARNSEEKDVEDVSKLERFKSLHFVHYDSPYAHTDFLNTMKNLDLSKPNIYIIDEVHNFIRNVYSNINSKMGKRARVIYEYIYKDRKENPNTRVILISATPAINVPFEFALLFNLLRPGIFPLNEMEFNHLFVTGTTYPILDPLRRNLFERRILGLVSYYIGATPDLYAKGEVKYINLTMSDYQYNIYLLFEKQEGEFRAKTKKRYRGSQLYRTYTQQASNFVFPYININIKGEFRPRPGKFKVSEMVADDLQKGKLNEEAAKERAVAEYVKALQTFINETEKYFQKIGRDDKTRGRTLFDDLEEFRKGFGSIYEGNILKYYRTESPKSGLFSEMYKCSPKMTSIVFLSYVSPGKVLIYSNYVMGEGIEIMKVYLKLAGFDDYTVARENMGYCEYHGRIEPRTRLRVKNMFNHSDNIRGSKCKIILLSPSSTEGIQLYNIRQEHIMEPHWNEVRIQQVIGRGIRQCSHKDLPMEERIVTVYRYKVVKPEILDTNDKVRTSTDEYIENFAKAKINLIESFLSAMREAAVDCGLFREHNMMTQSYHCFKFPESTLFGSHIGPAYMDDIKEDIKYDSGLHAKNSRIERIRVIKINAVIKLSGKGEPQYSPPNSYWYYPKTGVVYDLEMHFPVGRVEIVDGLPNKLDKNTYIISDMIEIPILIST
ncbi:MAG: DEAD/DEAH box helicase family protein [Nitrososphaerota archaeon]